MPTIAFASPIWSGGRLEVAEDAADVAEDAEDAVDEVEGVEPADDVDIAIDAADDDADDIHGELEADDAFECVAELETFGLELPVLELSELQPELRAARAVKPT